MKYKSMLDLIDLGKIKSAEMKASAMGSSELLVREKTFPLKRALDLILTYLILVGLSPFLVLIVLAIKIGSPGPVFYKQMRLGERGKPFTFYKFRSMYVNTDDVEHRSYLKDLIKAGNPYEIDQNGKPLFKICDDGRVTNELRGNQTGSYLDLSGFGEIRC